MGCVLFEMSTLRHAFSAHDLNSLASKICRGKIPPLPKTYSKDLTDLVKALLIQKTDLRPSVKDVLRMSFIRGHIVKYLEARQAEAGEQKPKLGKKDSGQDEDRQVMSQLKEEASLPVIKEVHLIK